MRTDRNASGSADAQPQPDLQAVARLTELADYVVPFALRATCQLGIADQLAAGPLPVGELAERTGSDASALLRCLRALAARGIFTETGPAVFGLTPLAQPLRADHPMSLREAYPLLAPDIRAWAAFGHSLRTGTASFDTVHGTGYWQYLAGHPRESARYNATQQASTRLELRSALATVDWGSFATIVDVGGGGGAFLAGLLARFTSVRGIVFDLPHVVVTAGPVAAAHGVADRCELVGGSFFDSVPPGADAYLLKRILPGYHDEDALALLRVVRTAMRADSRVLLIEPVVEPGDAFDAGKLQDVQLVTMVGGGARSRDQLDTLLTGAGMRLDRVTRTMMSPIVTATAV